MAKTKKTDTDDEKRVEEQLHRRGQAYSTKDGLIVYDAAATPASEAPESTAQVLAAQEGSPESQDEIKAEHDQRRWEFREHVDHPTGFPHDHPLGEPPGRSTRASCSPRRK
jgi:hypothetical protein